MEKQTAQQKIGGERGRGGERSPTRGEQREFRKKRGKGRGWAELAEMKKIKRKREPVGTESIIGMKKSGVWFQPGKRVRRLGGG